MLEFDGAGEFVSEHPFAVLERGLSADPGGNVFTLRYTDSGVALNRMSSFGEAWTSELLELEDADWIHTFTARQDGILAVGSSGERPMLLAIGASGQMLARNVLADVRAPYDALTGIDEAENGSIFVGGAHYDGAFVARWPWP